jgi:hypothetical protein
MAERWPKRKRSQGYRRLTDAFDRLSGTRIKTNILANHEAILDGFGLIESFRIVRQTRSGRMSELKVRLSDWMYNTIQGSEVLTLSRDYFRLREPVDRRVYELARKHCGEQEALSDEAQSVDVLRVMPVAAMLQNTSPIPSALGRRSPRTKDCCECRRACPSWFRSSPHRRGPGFVLLLRVLLPCAFHRVCAVPPTISGKE